jgi:hypothetical protein
MVIEMNSKTAETTAPKDSPEWLTLASLVLVAVATIIALTVVYLKKRKLQRVD